MLTKMRDALRHQSTRLCVAATTACAAMLPFAGAVNMAAEGGSDAGSIVSIITSAAEGLKGDAFAAMQAAVGLGLVFWGGKVLWSKFKSMAR